MEMIDYEDIIHKELKRRKIRVQKWCTEEPSNNYEAYINSRMVRIPKPVDAYHFKICLHEIGHVETGERIYAYLQEYNAERWAIKRAEYYGVIDKEYINDAKMYVLKHCITDVLVGGLTKVRSYVLDWIGVSQAQFEQLVKDNGLRLLIEYVRTYVNPKDSGDIYDDVYVDRKTLQKLKT